VNAANGAALRKELAVKYMFILIGEESDWQDVGPDEVGAMMEPWERFGRQATEAGVLVAGEGLMPSASATTLQIRPGQEPLVSDGPFAETKEQVGGFYVLDCRDLDDALAWGRRIPLQGGSIEVRPVFDPAAVAAGRGAAAEGARS
jgi:hypothetical protein